MRNGLGVLVFLALAQIPLYAQLNVGGIAGAVADQSQAAIPSVKVVATNTETSFTREVTSTTEGLYTFTELPIGDYTVTVAQQGFRRFEQQGIQVVSGETVTLNIVLSVGQLTEIVTVTGAPPTVDTTATNLGLSRTNQELASLPLFILGEGSRTAVGAILEMSGVNIANPTESQQYEMYMISRSPINGQQAGSTGYKIDGVDAGNGSAEDAQDFLSPVPDVVQEVRLTSNADASEGFTGGVDVSMTLKSGSNKLHGSVYDYNRNTALDARTFFYSGVPQDQHNEAGFTLGGPVVIPKLYNGKDKTFFFVGIDSLRFRTTAATFGGPQTATVPTMAERQGNFTDVLGAQTATDSLGRPVYAGEIYDPNTTRSNGSGGFIRDPYAFNGTINVIPPTQLSQISKTFVGQYAAPTNSALVNNWQGQNYESRTDRDVGVLKLDEIFSSKQRVSFSMESAIPWFITDKGTGSGYTGNSDIGGGGGYQSPAISNTFLNDLGTQRFRVIYAYTLSPNLLLSVRAGWNGTRNENLADFPVTGQKATFGATAGITTPYSQRTPDVTITGYSGFGSYNNENIVLAYQKAPVTVDLSWAKGAHNVRLGVDYVNVIGGWDDRINTQGTYNFAIPETGLPGVSGTGNGAASFMTGWVDNATVTSPNETRGLSGAWGFYYQDAWRATPKLTVNYGLRWDLFLPFRETHNEITTFDPNLANPGAGGRPGALSIYGTGPGRNGLTRIGNWYLKGLAPQLGLAYAFNSKTVIRANYGLTHGPGYNRWISSLTCVCSSDAFYLTRTAATVNSGVTPAFDWNNGLPFTFPQFPDLNPSLDNGSTISEIDPNNVPPEIQNFSLEIERELPGQVSVRVAYIGNIAHHLDMLTPYNLDAAPLSDLSLGNMLNQSAIAAGVPLPYTGFTGSVAQALSPYPQYLAVNVTGAPMGNDDYNSLQVNVQKRIGQGLTFLAAYTAAKMMTNVDYPGYRGSGSDTARHWSLIGSDLEHILNVDRPQMLQLSYAYDLPFGKGKRFAGKASGPLSQLVSGWRFSANQKYLAGTPVTVTTRAVNPIAASRPNLVPGQSIHTTSCSAYAPGNSTLGKYLNVKAFTTPAPFTLGYTGQLPNIRTCGFSEESMEVNKSFPIKENLRFTFGSIAENVFNRHNWTGLNSDTGNTSGFGTYSGTDTGRTIQFYLRLDF